MFQEGRIDSPEPLCLCDEGRLLSPDSPIPDFGHAKFETSIYTGSRSSSPTSPILDVEYSQLCPPQLECIMLLPDSTCPSTESLISDTELSELCLETLLDYGRPESPEPDSVQYEHSDSHRSDAAIHRHLSPESDISESDRALLYLDYPEDDTRPLSPESVSSINELTCLPPDSPVPQFRTSLSDHRVPCFEDRSSSPEFVTSDIDDSSFDLEEMFQNRPESPESDFYDNEPQESTSFSSGKYSLAQTKFIADNEASIMSPMFQLVYKAVPSTLMAHMYDPLYKGETFISKTGVFERAGWRMEDRKN